MMNVVVLIIVFFIIFVFYDWVNLEMRLFFVGFVEILYGCEVVEVIYGCVR